MFTFEIHINIFLRKKMKLQSYMAYLKEIPKLSLAKVKKKNIAFISGWNNW